MLGGFTFFEIGIALAALICIIVGYKRGFIAQLFGLLKFAGAIVVAAIFCGDAMLGGIFQSFLLEPLKGVLNFLGDNTETIAKAICNVIAFIALMIATSIVLSIIEKLLSKATKSKVLGNLDKVLGLVYAVALLYVIVLGLDFGVKYLVASGLGGGESTSFLFKIVAFVKQQVQDGKVIPLIAQSNWLEAILINFIPYPAG